MVLDSKLSTGAAILASSPKQGAQQISSTIAEAMQNHLRVNPRILVAPTKALLTASAASSDHAPWDAALDLAGYRPSLNALPSLASPKLSRDTFLGTVHIDTDSSEPEVDSFGIVSKSGAAICDRIGHDERRDPAAAIIVISGPGKVHLDGYQFKQRCVQKSDYSVQRRAYAHGRCPFC